MICFYQRSVSQRKETICHGSKFTFRCNCFHKKTVIIPEQKSPCSCFVSQGVVTGLDFLIMQLQLISSETVIFRLLTWTCNLILLKIVNQR